MDVHGKTVAGQHPMTPSPIPTSGGDPLSRSLQLLQRAVRDHPDQADS